MKIGSWLVSAFCIGGIVLLSGCGEEPAAPAKPAVPAKTAAESKAAELVKPAVQAAPSAAPAQTASRPAGQTVLGRSVERGNSADCANNLKQAGVFMMIYANDHGDWLPGSLGELVKSGCPENVLSCPGGDKFEYLIKSQTRIGGRNVPVAKCAAHNLVLFADGRVGAAE